MSLNWSVSKVKDWETVCRITATEDWPDDGIKKGDLLWRNTTTALAWHLLNIGVAEITEDNAPEVYARITLLERLYGSSILDRPINLDDVNMHVGLFANVKTESRTTFTRRHCTGWLDDKVRWAQVQACKKIAANATA